MTDKQPEALRLAQCIDFPSVHLGHAAAAELRRLYASEASLRDQNTELDRKAAELEAEVYEQAKLNGMGAERELRHLAVMRQALEALEYHTAQTRPIQRTNETILALHDRLAQPVQEPRREWVGLTDDEVAATYGGDLDYRDGDYLRYARAIEAKLREKNA